MQLAVSLAGLSAFGALVAGAMTWQPVIGTVEVGLGSAVLLVGFVDGIVAAMANFMTSSGLVEDA